MLQISNIDSYSTNTKVKDNQLNLGFIILFFKKALARFIQIISFERILQGIAFCYYAFKVQTDFTQCSM